MPTPGQLVRERRIAKGLTQAQLARRARTSQAAISRLERGELSPTYQTLEELLLAMGEVPQLSTEPLRGDHDPGHLAARLAMSPEKRVVLSWGWNRFAGEVAQAGARAREDAAHSTSVS